MGTVSNQQPAATDRILNMMLRGCEVARAAAEGCGECLSDSSPQLVQDMRVREEELDTLDREINEAVTTAIVHCHSELEVRELLACLKVINEVERIGDLLLGFATRAGAILSRLAEVDVRDLSTMATLLEKMLADGAESFRRRDAELALTVLRADMEMDRLRNLLFVRHIENPERAPQQESFHLVFMTTSLERAGDHAKNVVEEVVHLVTGRSVRHLLRAQDKPDEVRFLEYMRRRTPNRKPLRDSRQA
jgi:phosphate transport system protein